MDFELTPDGDLLLGQQLTDEEGYLLYYKIDPESNALPVLTRDVNEATVSVRDFKTIHSDTERLQLIRTRLRTDNPDWVLYQEVGASLSDFIGETNNPETARLIEKRIMETLTRNDAFLAEELTINVVPISYNEILADVILDSQNRYLRYAFSLDFDIGVNNTYVLDEEGNILEQEDKTNPDIYEGIPAYEDTGEDLPASGDLDETESRLEEGGG